jgi:NAD(P)-dependent dehydrogenase (short-subunit alcohol dehydrogenase family)
MTKDINKEITKTIPLKRYEKPSEVAHAVFFASTNTYMTAEVINISGGLAR